MTKKRRQFTREFKLEAVRRVEEGGQAYGFRGREFFASTRYMRAEMTPWADDGDHGQERGSRKIPYLLTMTSFAASHYSPLQSAIDMTGSFGQTFVSVAHNRDTSTGRVQHLHQSVITEELACPRS